MFQAPDMRISMMQHASARAKQNLHDALRHQLSAIFGTQGTFSSERTSRLGDNPDECATRA